MCKTHSPKHGAALRAHTAAGLQGSYFNISFVFIRAMREAAGWGTRCHFLTL